MMFLKYHFAQSFTICVMACKLLALLVMKLLAKFLKMLTVSWIAVAVAASGVSGMVLCFADDGHFAIEVAHQDSCPDTAGDSGQERHGLFDRIASASEESRGNCVDLSLSSDTLSQPLSAVNHARSLVDNLARVYAAASDRVDVHVETGLREPCTPRSAPLRASPFLLALRTIVLRV
jgi:hypothetical protein